MHDPPGRQKLPHPEVVSGVSTITRAMKSLLKRDTTNSILGGTGKSVLTVRLLNKPKRVANRSVSDSGLQRCQNAILHPVYAGSGVVPSVR